MNLAKKSIINFIGGVIPAIASLLTVPVIVSRLGEVEYGLFTLVTAIVGYFALIDINVTAGSVKYLAEHHARSEHDQVNQVVSFGGFIYFIIGLLGGLGIFFFADTLITSFFNVPPNLHETARRTLQAGAVAFFFSQMQVYLFSIPEALQRYDLTGKIESIFGALTSISTVAVVLLGGGLVEIIIVRLVLSIINCGMLLNMIQKILPFVHLVIPDRNLVNKLTSFSAYSYLSKIASITYSNGDKMLLGSLLDLKSVSLYSIPALLVYRVVALAYRFGQILFPVSSAMAAKKQYQELERLYITSTRYYIYLNASVIVIVSIFSRELLYFWAGPIFGSGASLVLVLIATAAFFDALTNLPSLMNDGLGKPRNTGLLALTRAIVGLALSYAGIKYAGYVGAAWAHLFVSALFSIIFITFIHNRVIPISLGKLYNQAYKPTFLPLLTVLTLSAIFSQRPVLNLFWFIAMLSFTSTLLLYYAWRVICLPHHRDPLLKILETRLKLGVGKT